MVNWKRTLRATSSERFLGQRDGKDAVAIDLHYLENGTVSGTVIILKDSGIKELDLQKLLSDFDEDFLPGVDLKEGNLSFTVVWGEVHGHFEASEKVQP